MIKNIENLIRSNNTNNNNNSSNNQSSSPQKSNNNNTNNNLFSLKIQRNQNDLVTSSTNTATTTTLPTSSSQTRSTTSKKPIVLSQYTDVSEILNFNQLRQDSKDELANTLRNASTNHSTSKALVVDPKFIGLLNLIADPSFLKLQGIDKIYELKKGKLDTDCKHVIYLMKPNVEYCHTIAEHIRQHIFDFDRKEYSIIYVPRVSPICQKVLEEIGVFGYFSKFLEFSLDIIAFDSDVLSLELPKAYRNCILDHDYSSLYFVAKSIMKIQSMFGLISHIKGIGPCSKMVSEHLSRMKTEWDKVGDTPPYSTEIDSLILMDRDVDMITPMCTPLTYEGLIDEYYSINNNRVYFDANIINPESNQHQQQQFSKPISNSTTTTTEASINVNSLLGTQPNSTITTKRELPFPLHSGDKVYQEIRDMNFSKLAGNGGVLNLKAKQIDELKRTNSLSGKESLAAIKELMKRINSSQFEETSLTIHVGIAEKIQEITSSVYFQHRLETEQRLLSGFDIHLSEQYIDSSIMTKDSILKVFRLLSLYSLVNNGLRNLDYYKSRIIQVYGCEWMLTLNNLEKLGLLKRSPSSSSSSLNNNNDGSVIMDFGYNSSNTGGNGGNKKPFNYPAIRKELDLIVDDINEQNPQDIAYVYSGYAPISVRLIQYSMGKSGNSIASWKSIDEDILKMLPNPSFEEIQSNQNYSSQTSTFKSTTSNNNNNEGSDNHQSNNNPITVVCFIGGVTFSEISALRFLGRKTNRRFIVLTTKIIKGDSLIDSLIEKFDD
eukprot:gene3640-4532_t